MRSPVWPIIVPRPNRPTIYQILHEFKKGSGAVVPSTLRAVPATVSDPFLNPLLFIVR